MKRIIITFKGWGADKIFRQEVPDDFFEHNLKQLVDYIGDAMIKKINTLRMLEDLKK